MAELSAEPGPWADTPAVLDPRRPFDRGRLLVSAINPVYLHSVDYRPSTAHWKDLILGPETMRVSGERERYVPASLISPERTRTFGPFGAVIAAPGTQLRQAKSAMEYDPATIDDATRPLNPDPDAVFGGHNEVMVRCGEHVRILGFFAKALDGQPADPIGAAIAKTNAERLNVPFIQLPEQLPPDEITTDEYSGRVTAVHDGFQYTLHDPRYPNPHPWQGAWRPYPNYEFRGFPDEDAARQMVVMVREQLGNPDLADGLWQRYVVDRGLRQVPQVTDADVLIDRRYGRDAERIVIGNNARAWRYREADFGARGWDGVEGLFPRGSDDRSALVTLKNQLNAKPVPPDEAVEALVVGVAAADGMDNPAARESATAACRFYERALQTQRNVIGGGDVFPSDAAMQLLSSKISPPSTQALVEAPPPARPPSQPPAGQRPGPAPWPLGRFSTAARWLTPGRGRGGGRGPSGR